ncbi:hypothetical protein ACWEH1_24210, partial [Micromonospora chersina]
LSVLGSTDGGTWSTLVASAGRLFDPATGNQVSLAFPATPARYVQVRFTGNTGWPAGQLAQLSVHSG